ncbi:MAG: hypothetical protein H6815_13215 [Phycisphaeraceae bacterium]|nr:hypothetical protein [Phycisphaerales bacterium]MCB9861399.1 hypothetical protein [Phycisphaeraceae bacterium]
MNRPPRDIPKLMFQILSTPEGNGVIMEVLDENEDAIMEINIDADGSRHVVLYHSSEHLSIPLTELENAIATAKEHVVLVDPESLFDS